MESRIGVLEDLKSLSSRKDGVRALRWRIPSMQHYMVAKLPLSVRVDVRQCAQEARECGIMSLVSAEVD